MDKICCTCKKEQPETNYHKNCTAPDGLQNACKDCGRAYNKAHRDAHREKHLEYDKQYRAVHIEERRGYISAYDKAHRGKKNEYMKQYYAAHRAATRKATDTWRKSHPEATRVYYQTREAKKAGLARSLTSAQWKHILSEFSNTCAYCGAGGKTLHQEHFIPVSAGGEYTHNNIIPACARCNSSKGARDYFVWYPTFDCYDKQREKKVMRFLHYTGVLQQLTLCSDKEKI